VLQDSENQQETDLEKIPNRRLCHIQSKLRNWPVVKNN